MTLGDETAASTAAARALREGERHAAELRHPERAAAWLRQRVVRMVGGGPRRRAASGTEREALAQLGTPGVVVDALGALSLLERAALVARDIERLELRDVERIVGRSPGATHRLLCTARRRYLELAAASLERAREQEPVPHGELRQRVWSHAARAMGWRGAE